jgi:hypothetical protein
MTDRRGLKPWALVLWGADLNMIEPVLFFESFEAALDATPDDVRMPSSIVNTARRSSRNRPLIDDIVTRGRRAMEIDCSLHPGRRAARSRPVRTCRAPGCERTFTPCKEGHWFCSTDCRKDNDNQRRKEQRAERASAIAATIAAKEQAPGPAWGRQQQRAAWR